MTLQGFIELLTAFRDAEPARGEDAVLIETAEWDVEPRNVIAVVRQHDGAMVAFIVTDANGVPHAG